MTEPRPLEGRTALITGASRGLGAAIARAYAAAGAHVILLARTVGALEEVDDGIREQGGQATLIPQDLRRLDDLDRLGPTLYERFGGLDIFVANAAILGTLSPMGHYEPKVWQQVFDTNVHANWRLIRTLEPLLRNSAAGRALLVTTDLARHPRPFWAPYAASKAALETMALSWAAELTKTPIRINLVDPGPMATALRARAYPGEDQATLPRPDTAAQLFLAPATPAFTETGTCLAA